MKSAILLAMTLHLGLQPLSFYSINLPHAEKHQFYEEHQSPKGSLEEQEFQMNPNLTQKTEALQQEGIPSMKLYETLLQNSPKNTEILRFKASNYESLKQAFYQVYEKLPSKAIIEINMNKEQANIFMDIIKDGISVRNLPNYHLLANYSIKQIGNQLILTDNTHKLYQASQIESSIKEFSNQFAKSIEHLSPLEKFQVIYDYVYSQFKYNASGYQKMLIGNAYNYEMACNGFSKLMFELLNASGIETISVEGEDHLYNHVKTSSLFEQASENDWFILDVTTDILLETSHGATGKSQEDYLNYVKGVGFYFATPIEKETSVSTPLTEEQMQTIIELKTPFNVQDKTDI